MALSKFITKKKEKCRESGHEKCIFLQQTLITLFFIIQLTPTDLVITQRDEKTTEEIFALNRKPRRTEIRCFL